MPLRSPLSVQFTEEQLAWIDSRRTAGLTRSAALRLIVQNAMLLESKGAWPVQAADAK